MYAEAYAHTARVYASEIQVYPLLYHKTDADCKKILHREDEFFYKMLFAQA